MSDNHAVLLEQEIADLKGRLAEAVVQENEATRLHSQQHSSVMMYSAHHTEQQLRQDLLHNQIMSQIAQNKLTLMTRLRRAETDLNMLRLQQQQQQQSMLMAASQAPSSPPHMLHHHPGPPFMQPPVPRPPMPPQQPVAPPPPHTLLHPTQPHLPPHAVSEFPGPTSVSPYQRHPVLPPRHYHPSGANRFHRPLSHTGAPPHMDSYRDPMQHPSQRYPSPHHSTPPYPSPEVAHRAAAASNFANARDTDSRHAAKSSTSNDVIGYQRELLNQHDDSLRENVNLPHASFRHSAPPPHERGVTSIQQPPNAIRENENNTSSASCYSSSSSSVSPSKEFFINNRELFNKARYDSEPEYREWCLKYNIVSVNDHGIKKQFGNIDSHSNDADYRSSNSHTRGDSDFRQRTLPPRNSSHFETDAPKVAEDIDDRVVSRLSHFSHRPLSSDSSSPQKQRPHEPGMSSSTTHSRSLAPSYSREERRGDAPMLAERDKEVSTSKFEQEFFDENHGPEPGHPYYHIWYNKFIKKPPPPTPATHSRHSPSSVCGGRKQDSDYRHSRGAVEVGRSSHGMEGGGGGARSSDNIRHHNSHHPVINSRRSGGHSYRHEEELIRNLTPPPKSRYEPHGHTRGGGTDMDLDEDHRHHPSDPMLLDPRHPSSSPSLQVAATPPPPLPPPPPAEPPPEAPEKPADVYQLDQMLSVPGRVEQQRLRNTLIIIRGPPGAGKSYIAKLIKDKEVAAGMTPPRILSIDDYFMVADESGKSVGGMVYEYEEDMEEVYLAALAKAFSKTVGEGKDRLVVIDACNHLLKHFQQFVTIAQHNLIKVFVIEMLPPVEVCLEQNVHKRTEAEIRNILDKWEDAPNTLPRLDASHFMKKQQQQQQKNKNNPPANDASCDVIKTNSSSTKQTTGSKLNGTNLASSAGKKSSEEDVFCEDVASTCETNAVGSRKRQRSDSLELSDAEETSPAAATKQDWKHASRTRHSKPGNKNEEKVATSAPKYTFAAAPANSGTRIKKDANEEMKNAAGSSGPASVDEVYYEPGSPTTGCGSPSPSRSTASTSAYQSAATSQHGPIGRGDSSFSCSSGGLKGVVGSVGSDSDSESDSDCSYSSSPLFTSCLPKQVKSKWEILDNTEHNSLDKMDGVTTAATSCSKQGKNMTRSCVLGRDDKDRRLSDSSADDVDDDVTRQEGAAAVAGPSTTKGEVSSSYTSKRETIEDFLNSCGDYLQRQPTDKSGKKRVRWADVEERREIEQEKRLGFIVGRTNWHRLMNEDEATTAALTKTKFI